MAVVYSLVCFGGKDGKTVTFTDAGDVVNLASHGLRNGTGVVFTDNSGNTLPTGLTKGTTYYARSTASGTFTLFPTANDAINNTNQVTFSGTGTGTHKVKSAYYVGLSDKSRWTTGGVEQIYDGIAAWISGRSGALATDEEIGEIGMAWTDIGTAQRTITIPSGRNTLTTMVNGVRSEAFHGGVFGAGYIAAYNGGSFSGISLGRLGDVIDGIEVNQTNTGYAPSTALGLATNCVAKNMLIKSASKQNTVGVSNSGSSPEIHNSVVTGFATGYSQNAYQSFFKFTNCVAYGNTTGFAYNSAGGSAGNKAYVLNCVSLGNTTNWQASATDLTVATNNLGGTGEAWVKSPGIIIGTTDTAPFSATFTNTSTLALSPASVTSALVENGTEFFGNYLTDINGSVRPSYPGGNYNTAVTAGSFVTGLSYTIATVGTTDFTLIGASANTVGVTFKATGAGTGTGTATLNAKLDIGAYEFNLGYGGWPQTQQVSISGIQSGSRIKIAKQSDGTEVYNSTSPSWPQTTSFSTDTPVYIYVRKGSAAPYYHPVKISSIIDSDAGLTADITGLQQGDIASAPYTVGVASDWTFNSETGAITHASGTTIYTVQDLYSWHQDYYDDSATVDDNPLMRGITPSIFELLNGGTITNAHIELLKGGSIKFEDDTLWSNLWTAGSLTGTPTLYIVQNGSKYTPFWSSGHVDVLLKVSNAGTLIDSGIVTVYARKFGYTYDNYEINLSAGGRNVAPVSTFADPAITNTSVTVGGWTDIATTFGTYSEDFGDGDGAQTYYCKIDCNNRPLSEVYQYMQYLTREDSSATLNGVSGWKYDVAHTGYIPNKSAPFGNYSGGIWNLAKGVWLYNVPSGDLTNYILTDDAGNTHQNTVALNQSVTVNGLVVGSRVQVYDTTSDTELVNEVATTSSVSWEDPSAPTGDRSIRVRIAYQNGTDARQFIEANVGTCGTSSSTKDVTYLASQVDDTVYIANNINGSTVNVPTTIITIDDSNLLVNLDTGSISIQQIYAYEAYWLFTEEGIRDEGRFIDAVDTANYRLAGFSIKNVSSPSTPLVITGGYPVDASTGNAIDIIDTTGGTIFLAPDHVVPYSSGAEATVAIVQSGLTAQGYTGTRASKIDTIDKNAKLAVSLSA